MPNNQPISESAVKSIRDQDSLLQFLREHLDWELPDDPIKEEVTFQWGVQELKLSESSAQRLEDGVVYQLRPMIDRQPWGVFFIEFKSDRIYKTDLRNVLRGLVPKRRRDSSLPSWQHDNILFICITHNNQFTFAQFRGEKAHRAKLTTFSWMPGEPVRTLCEFNLPALRMPDRDLAGVDPHGWISQWNKAFDIKPVTDEFYRELRKVFEDIQKYIHGIKTENKRAFSQLVINRLLFLKFLERKGWLFVDKDDSLEQRRMYLRRKREKLGRQNHWQQFFYHLFFSGLNRPSLPGVSQQTDAMKQLIGYVPFLNGGLFEPSRYWNDKNVKVDNELFDEIFNRLLDQYNFTIQENTPIDIEVALNPDLLGYAYEELIAERHGQGAFYTHPTEVGLMCRESIKTYLEEHTEISKESIAKLIDERDASLLSEQDTFTIYKRMLKLKIVDPAIGSGAYPVRMMQELVGVYRVLANKMTEGQFHYILENKLADPRSVYDLKLGIVENNIYGADIDYFAVEIAKLRFWLSLVVDYDMLVETPDDLEKIPALPNLDFKFRIGESLVASLGRSNDDLINFDVHLAHHKTRDAFFESQVDNLLKIKNNYFNFEELRKQGHHLDKSKDDLREEIARMEKDIAKSMGFSTLRSVEITPHVLWQIHFAEIFIDEQAGFDICIANPPYVRQEKINDLFDSFNIDLTKDELVDTYEEIYKDQDLKINRQSDLYVYFYFRGINLLRSKGVLCFICSTSWLDLAYGINLQEFLLGNTHIKAIFDNSAIRSFEKASINTTINLFVKKDTIKSDNDNNSITRFVAFKRSFEIVTLPDQIRDIYNANSIVVNDDYRVYPIRQNVLLDQGRDENNKYKGDKWGGKYLRAPDIFFTILEKGMDKLLRLGDIAEVRFGIKTGANEFFYLDNERIQEWGIEKEFLKPVLKSGKNSKTIIIDKKKLNTKIFLCNKEKKELKSTNALQYIEWGENSGYHKISSVQGRRLWYDVGAKTPADAIMIRRIGERCPFFESNGVLEDCVLFGITLEEKFDKKLLLATLNFIWTRFWIELMTRQLTGAQAVADTNVYVVKDVAIVDPRKFSKKQREKVIDAYLKFRENESQSIFIEAGLDKNKSIRSQRPSPLPYRKSLDDVFFDYLGLNNDERIEVYWSVCELVQNRLMKARSV